MNWTKEGLRRFQRAHAEAADDGKKSFVFDGCEFDVNYARHLITYLLGVLK